MKRINSTMFVVLTLTLMSSSAVAEGWGNLKVRLVFGGDVPVPAKINVNKDVNFCGKHGLVDEGLLVNKENKGIANVIVYVRDKGVSIHPSYESDDPIMVDNTKCRFSPHVTPVWTKRTLMLKKAMETYKRAAFDEQVEIWQAGKGVDRIESIESCADVLEGYRKGLM